MTKRYTQIVLLCEDDQHRDFARVFIGEYFGSKRVVVRPYPQGKGAGTQFVQKNLPIEIAAHRKRYKRMMIALIIIVDADTDTTAQKRKYLMKLIADAGIEPPNPDERIAIFIPRRNIETWIEALQGSTVDETTDLKSRRQKKGYQAAVKQLARQCKNSLPLDAAMPPSLQEACAELTRIPRF